MVELNETQSEVILAATILFKDLVKANVMVLDKINTRTKSQITMKDIDDVIRLVGNVEPDELEEETHCKPQLIL